MARPKIPPGRVPTPGPWLVRGTADAAASPATATLGVEPAADRAGGFTYFIWQDRTFAPGETPLHLAVGIQRLADAMLMAAAPDLAALVLRLLTSPGLMRRDLDPETRLARDAAWNLLVRVAPHLEI